MHIIMGTSVVPAQSGARRREVGSRSNYATPEGRPIARAHVASRLRPTPWATDNGLRLAPLINWLVVSPAVSLFHAPLCQSPRDFQRSPRIPPLRPCFTGALAARRCQSYWAQQALFRPRSCPASLATSFFARYATLRRSPKFTVRLMAPTGHGVARSTASADHACHTSWQT